LSHPSIARLISSFRFQDGAYLVLEYASKGDLHDLLRKNGSLDHESTRFVMGEVVAVLQSIHDAGFVYGDLKPENILITESGHIKLTDFGGCRPFTDSAKQLIKSRGRNALKELRDGNWRVAGDARLSSADSGQSLSSNWEDDNRIEGTTAYLPPEVAIGGTPTPAADSWALGCVLYQCLSGKPPIIGDTDEQTVRRIVGFYLDDSKGEDILFGHREAPAFTPITKALIQALLNVDPGSRLSMLSIAQHEFFAGINVFTMFKGSAPALMQGSVAPSMGDTKWTRRQFSSIWAPQPKAYLLGPKSNKSHSSLDMTPFEMEIEEGSEINASFVPKVTLTNILSKIKEVCA
jgi:serine/threonine protein kinase